ncbi:MAG: hypothetical protein LZ168_07600 [Thaumarchaeota archaeon]|jgi:predicted membrane protein (TIGR00267 family)|nr:hypothetical protein [Candidatus Geocrenenecus arthurdayi]
MFKKTLSRLGNTFKKIFRYSRSAEYSRRYFVINAFEGALTIWGIILGIHLLGSRQVFHVVSGGIGAIIAMAISGVSSVYIAESAEQERRIKEIEEALLMRIEGTEIMKAHKRAVIMSALINSLASSLAGLLVLSPYLAAASNLIESGYAFTYSMIILFTTLFIIGVFLGKVSGRSLIFSGLKTVGIAGAVIVVLYLLDLMS